MCSTNYYPKITLTRVKLRGKKAKSQIALSSFSCLIIAEGISVVSIAGTSYLFKARTLLNLGRSDEETESNNYYPCKSNSSKN